MFSGEYTIIQKEITKEDIKTVEDALNAKGKFEIVHFVEGINQKGVVCVRATMNIYLWDDKIHRKVRC